MSPHFVGRGTWGNWSGVGVSQSPEPAELVRVMAWLAAEHGGVDVLVEHVLGQEGGWRSVLQDQPLSSSSVDHPFRVTADSFHQRYRGLERGVFLQDTPGSSVLRAYLGEEHAASVYVDADGRGVVEWYGQSERTEVVVEPPAAVRALDYQDPVVDVSHPCPSAPPGFIASLRRHYGDGWPSFEQAVAARIESAATEGDRIFLLARKTDQRFCERVTPSGVRFAMTVEDEASTTIRIAKRIDHRWDTLDMLPLATSGFHEKAKLNTGTFARFVREALTIIGHGGEAGVGWQAWMGQHVLRPLDGSEEGYAALGSVCRLMLVCATRPS